MKNFIVVADQDRGKSFFIKNELLPRFQDGKRKNFIYDINREYGKFKNEVRGLPTKDDFLRMVPDNNNSNCNVVFEEATAFFSRAGVGESKVNQHIFRRFHTGNLNIFVFHGLNFIPSDILHAIDFFVIFKTTDRLDQVEKKFSNYPKIINAFLDVQQKTKDTFFDRENKRYADQRSKQFFHYKAVVAK